jgi:septal ring factor EnvC (AmiA/AmiB activator)
MTIAESGERPEGGKPEGGRGRITSTVRFSPMRLADLREVAASHGRSLSEEIEFRIEAYARHEAEMQSMVARHEAEMQEMLAQLYDHQNQIGRHQQEIRALKEAVKSASDKEAASADERIARIVADAVARVFSSSRGKK